MEGMSKNKRILFLIAIMATNIIIIGESALTPIYYKFYEIFPDNAFIANTLVSGPQLIIVFTSLCATALMKKFSKKNIMIVGAIIFAVGGIFGVASTSAGYMILMRMLFGIGTSLVNVAAVAIIADEYPGDVARGRIMGIYNAVMAAIGAIMSFASGLLAVINWTDSFYIYLVAIPVILLLIFFVPKSEKSEVAEKTEQGKREPYGSVFWITTVDFFIYNVCYAFMMFLTSSYVTENGLGNEAYIGIIASIGTIGSFMYCLLFGSLFERLGKNYIVVNYLITVLCMVLLFLFQNTILLMVIAFVFGCTYGSSLTYTFTYTSMVVPKSRIDDSIGIIVAVFSLACFVSTYYYTALMSLLHTDTVTGTLPGGIVLAIIITVVEIVLGLKMKKQKESVR